MAGKKKDTSMHAEVKVRVRKELKNRIIEEAEKRSMSVSELVRVAIEDYFDDTSWDDFY